MKVKELREALEGLPDGLHVVSTVNDGMHFVSSQMIEHVTIADERKRPGKPAWVVLSFREQYVRRGDCGVLLTEGEVKYQTPHKLFAVDTA